MTSSYENRRLQFGKIITVMNTSYFDLSVHHLCVTFGVYCYSKLRAIVSTSLVKFIYGNNVRYKACVGLIEFVSTP